jgi:ribosomal protein L1
MSEEESKLKDKSLKTKVAVPKKIPAKKTAVKKLEKVSEPEQTIDTGSQKPETEPKATAKAGKRSAKAIAEVEEKVAKEERKASKSEEATDDKPKKAVKPTRSRLERRGKKFREVAKLIEKDKVYSIKEAIDLALKTSTTKFDSTVEVHVRLGVDPRQADQNIRDNIVLPSGTGKTLRVAVFAEEDVAKQALKAGADIAGEDDFLKLLDKGEINFDILISTPNMMVKLSKYARILGPKGLMPNPKSGTVTNDINKAISQSKAGKVEYRVDSTGIVHLGVGKVSFGQEKIAKNIEAVFASIKVNKPSSIKGTYVKSIVVTTSMGPSVKVNPADL